VTSSSETLKKRVEGVLDMALTTISSLSESFVSGAPVITEEVGLSQRQDQIASPKENHEMSTWGNVFSDVVFNFRVVCIIVVLCSGYSQIIESKCYSKIFM